MCSYFFSVVRSAPPLNASDVKKLEDMLNEKKDLSGFVVALRRKFVDLANGKK
jgi:hypothetical protein